jgi:hypothetical protein
MQVSHKSNAAVSLKVKLFAVSSQVVESVRVPTHSHKPRGERGKKTNDPSIWEGKFHVWKPWICLILIFTFLSPPPPPPHHPTPPLRGGGAGYIAWLCTTEKITKLESRRYKILIIEWTTSLGDIQCEEVVSLLLESLTSRFWATYLKRSLWVRRSWDSYASACCTADMGSIPVPRLLHVSGEDTGVGLNDWDLCYKTYNIVWLNWKKSIKLQ